MPGTDGRDLRLALRTIREIVPTAVSADFERSDQGSYGFNLVDVALADGTLFSDVDEIGWEHLRDEIEPYVCNTTFRGVMGDTRHEDRVTVEVPQTQDKAQLAADEYHYDLRQALTRFDENPCSTCGMDIDRHYIAPIDGQPNIYCTDGLPV